jgi:hypothetical protein
VPGYIIATISLKPVGGIPGDATADQIRLMADLAKDYSFDELRVTHAQNIVLPHVRKADLFAFWEKLVAADLATANLNAITDIIACPGLDYCSLANARSIPVAQKISERFTANGKEETLGELKLKISAASTPAATTMQATSASSAWTARVPRTTSCCWAAAKAPTPRWARSPAPASTRTVWSTPSTASPTSIWPSGRRASVSSTPIAASAWPLQGGDLWLIPSSCSVTRRLRPPPSP